MIINSLNDSRVMIQKLWTKGFCLKGLKIKLPLIKSILLISKSLILILSKEQTTKQTIFRGIKLTRTNNIKNMKIWSKATVFQN